MASQQSIIWTVVPNNIVTDENQQRFLRLSVFVSLRLSARFMPAQPPPPTMKLRDFPDFLDWPATVEQIRFSVVFKNGPLVGFDPDTGVRRNVPAPPRDITGSEITSVWKELFDRETVVIPYQFDDQTQKDTVTYQVAEVSEFVESKYLDMAQQQPGGPSNTAPQRASLRAALLDINVNNSLDNVEQFNRALESPPRDGSSSPPSLDFHEMVASFGEYSQLMRSLGLVIELEVPLTPDIRLEDSVRVDVAWLPRLPKLNAGGQLFETTFNEQPWTRYTLDPQGGRFRAAPRDGETDHLNGMLHLAHTEGGKFVFHREPFDTHAQAIKLRAFAQQGMGPNDRAFPSIRSAGIAISRKGLGERLMTELSLASTNNEQVLNNQSDNVTLFAEDLIRGYRVDVRNASAPGQWFSLCRRRGTYTFLKNSRQVLIEDEGWVSHGVVQTAGEQSVDPDRLAIHETLFRWDGWSLCVPRPGRALLPGEQLGEGDTQTNPVIKTAFTVQPGTLPRLRFGRSYNLRARVVDLVGNSLPLDDNGDALLPAALTEEIKYGRFESAPAPLVVLREPLTDEQDRPLRGKEGESFECLVIRSNFDSQVSDPSKRHLVPHKTSQALAEAHGLSFFETPLGLKPEAYDDLKRLDGALELVHDTDQMELPYLPDVLSSGLMIYGLPDRPADQALTLDFYPAGSQWPHAKPWRVNLAEGDFGVRIVEPDMATRTEGLLTIFMPKAEVVTLRLVSRLTEEGLDLMGLWHRLEKAIADPVTLRVFREEILKGFHQMFTPHREIKLTHAVQQPLFKPQLQPPPGGGALLTHTRNPGDTSARLLGELQVPAKSASKLELLAAWTEMVDDGSAAHPPSEISPSTQVFQVDLPAPEGATAEDFTASLDHLPGDPPNEFVSPLHEFGDTKHRNVNYTFVATTRFTEFFPDGTSPLTRESDTLTVDIKSSARPPAPQIAHVIPTFGWEEKTEEIVESPTVRIVKRTRKRLGNSVRVYLKRPWFVSGDGELLGVVVAQDPVDVPLSLQPHVTRIGDDPTVPLDPDPSDIDFYPGVSSFPNTVQQFEGFSLEEARGAKIDIAGHRVDFDEERGLWYCDIVIDPDRFVPASYYPFVRLMLVRIQPSSLDGLHLSSLTPADFVQIAPPREASITQNVQNLDEIKVSVSGYFPSKVENKVTVSVETPRQFVEGDLKWMPTEINDQPLDPTGEAHNKRWTGTVTHPQGAGNIRIMIKEYEVLPSDDPQQPTERLVYADAFVR